MEEFENYTITQLRNYCKQHDFTQYTKLNKKELILYIHLTNQQIENTLCVLYVIIIHIFINSNVQRVHINHVIHVIQNYIIVQFVEYLFKFHKFILHLHKIINSLIHYCILTKYVNVYIIHIL